jgi:hypothetical protein
MQFHFQGKYQNKTTRSSLIFDFDESPKPAGNFTNRGIGSAIDLKRSPAGNQAIIIGIKVVAIGNEDQHNDFKEIHRDMI